MKFSFKSIAKPAFILFLVCFITTAFLAGTNVFTEKQIATLEVETAIKAEQSVLPAAATFTEQTLTDANGKTVTYSVGADDTGATVGYVFNVVGNGYGGTFNSIIGIDSKNNVTGVQLLNMQETPGMGARAAYPSYRDQYLQPAPADGFTVIKSGTPAPGQIEALTGSTITSKAVTLTVNEAIGYTTIIEGGAGNGQ